MKYLKDKILEYEAEIIRLKGLLKDSEQETLNFHSFKSEEKYRELVENINVAFILRSEKETLYVNPAFEKIFGYKSEILFKNIKNGLEWIYIEDKERILARFKKARDSNEFQFEEQYRVVKADGSIIWIWHRSTPILNAHGEVYRVVEVATDITEIKQLEEKLRKSKYQQQAILDNIPHLAWLKDKDGFFISANQAFCKYFNMKHKQIRGKTDYDLCPKHLADDYIEKDKQVLREAKPKSFFEVEENESGRHFSETIKSPVLNDEGEVIGIVGISRDITEQKIAEKALLASEEKYKDLVTLLPETVFETDENGMITFVNQKAFENFGYTLSDFEKGVSIFDILVPEDLERAKESFLKTKAGLEMGGTEYTIFSADQQKFQIMVFTNNMFQDGKWTGIRGVAIDITKKKLAENQEKEYQSRLLFLSATALDFLDMPHTKNIFEYIGTKIKQLVKGENVIVSRFDEDSSILSMEYFSGEKNYLSVFKSTVGKLDKDINIKISPEHIEILKTHTEHFYEFRDGLYEATFHTFPRNVCINFEVLLEISRVNGMSLMKSGKLYGVVLILARMDDPRDKTLIETFIYQASIALHRRQLEHELVLAKEKAEESDKLKTAFIANMSHEIRTPMNGILGLTQLMHNPRLSEEDRKEYLSLISTNGKILLNLVNDIIDISRIEANQVDLTESVFSVDQLFKDIELFFRSEKMIKKKNAIDIRVKNDLQVKESRISGDQQKIRQVLTNLVNNAIKFTNTGIIEVGCRFADSNQIIFFVKDTGIGISPGQLEYVFNRFTQVDQSLTRLYSGSGLGLAICKGFVEKMGGKIWVESQEGKGSVFYFSIPFKALQDDREEIIKVSPGNLEYNWEKLCILVVEDNFVSFKLVELSLRKTGVKILHADDGVKAVEMVKLHPEINLVLMDIQLPLLNGYDATRKIKSMYPNLPVIAQTANATDDDRLLCLNSGCSDYITKPINLDRLHQVINENIVIR